MRNVPAKERPRAVRLGILSAGLGDFGFDKEDGPPVRGYVLGIETREPVTVDVLGLLRCDLLMLDADQDIARISMEVSGFDAYGDLPIYRLFLQPLSATDGIHRYGFRALLSYAGQASMSWFQAVAAIDLYYPERPEVRASFPNDAFTRAALIRINEAGLKAG